MSLNLYATPLVSCTLGINPAPIPDALGHYHVRLATVNELSLEGPYLQSEYDTVNRAMLPLVGLAMGEYRYARNLSRLTYVRFNTRRQSSILRPYFRLLSYTLTKEGKKIHIDGIIQPLDLVRFDWVLTRNQGLIFSMRSKVSLMGETKALRGIISFDLEDRKYIESRLLWRVTPG